jgi:hypothetical protein
MLSVSLTETLSIITFSYKCHFAESRRSKCHVFNCLLSVVMLDTVILDVVMLSVVAPNFITASIS